MSNWREMSAGRELDRVVAERAGWRIEHLETIEYTDPKSASVAWYAIFDPTGEPMIRQAGYQWTNEWPHYDMDVIPPYSTDANVALALLDGLHWTARGTYDSYEGRMIYRCAINGKSGDPIILPSEKWAVGDTLAQSIVRTWLDWNDAQKSAQADR